MLETMFTFFCFRLTLLKYVGLCTIQIDRKYSFIVENLKPSVEKLLLILNCPIWNLIMYHVEF